MINFDDKHDELLVFDLAEDAIVTDTVAPEASKIMLESVAEGPWIGCRCYTVVKVAKNKSPYRLVEFGEITISFFAKFSRPSHTCDRSRRD